MPNPVTSVLFGIRSVDKFSNNHYGRGVVAVGQFNNALTEVAKFDGAVGKSAKTAVQAFEKLAKSEKLFEYAGKAVNIISKGVNPLICASSALDVLMAEDKESALVTNATALTAMFTVESLMKKHLDDVVKIKGIDKIAEKVTNFAKKYKHGDKISKIISGIAFVVGSCAAYSVGEKFGKLLLGKKDGQQAA